MEAGGEEGERPVACSTTRVTPVHAAVSTTGNVACARAPQYRTCAYCSWIPQPGKPAPQRFSSPCSQSGQEIYTYSFFWSNNLFDFSSPCCKIIV
jgi:hypothetical protein